MKTKKVIPSPEGLNAVISFLDEILSEYDIAPDIRYKVNIAADEILSNIINYSGAKGVSVGCSMGKRCCILKFWDDGIPYDPSCAKEPDITLPAKERQGGGLGIYLSRHMAESMCYQYQDGFNVLTIVIKTR